jgi:hypothetical protein
VYNHKGVAGLDLGWRTFVLKHEFFENLGAYDHTSPITHRSTSASKTSIRQA